MNVIWFNPALSLEELQLQGANNMADHLGMRWEEIGPDYLVASMPVDHRTMQPYGLLHGGASVALAETIGSVGAHMSVNPEKFIAVGMEVNANHIRSVREGRVFGKAKPLHRGASSQVWEIRIEDHRGKLVCISRLTVAILKRPS